MKKWAWGLLFGLVIFSSPVGASQYECGEQKVGTVRILRFCGDASGLVLEENERTGKKVFKFNNKLVYTVPDEYMFASVERVFNIKGNKAILVSLSTGGGMCPAEYIFLTIKPDGSSVASQVFGTCSDLPEITQKGDQIFVKLPNMKGKGKVTYIYKDGKVSISK